MQFQTKKHWCWVFLWHCLAWFCTLSYFYWPAAEPLADARGTLGFRWTPVENHCCRLKTTDSAVELYILFLWLSHILFFQCCFHFMQVNYTVFRKKHPLCYTRFLWYLLGECLDLYKIFSEYFRWIKYAIVNISWKFCVNLYIFQIDLEESVNWCFFNT